MLAHVIEDGGLQAAKTKIVGIAARFNRAELHRSGNAIRCSSKPVENRPAWIAEAQQLGNFVVCFAGGIVARLADFAILKCAARFVWLHFIQNSVATGYDETYRRQFRFAAALVLFEENSVDVTLNIVALDKR